MACNTPTTQETPVAFAPSRARQLCKVDNLLGYRITDWVDGRVVALKRHKSCQGQTTGC
jgi:hypothetical protein